MEPASDSFSQPLRIALAVVLAVCALLLLLRFAATLGGAVSLFTPVAHGALALLAALAAVGLWGEARWAPGALVALGCTFAATRIVEALVLGIRPWLFALLSAAAALGAAFVLAAWMRPRAEPFREAPPSRARGRAPR